MACAWSPHPAPHTLGSEGLGLPSPPPVPVWVSDRSPAPLLPGSPLCLSMMMEGQGADSALISRSCLSPRWASGLRHHSPWPVSVLRLHVALGAGAAGLGMNRAVPSPCPPPLPPLCQDLRRLVGREAGPGLAGLGDRQACVFSECPATLRATDWRGGAETEG